MARGMDDLTQAQRALLAEWLPGVVVEDDMSWGLIDTVVLRVRCEEQPYVVKAGGPGNHHLDRELQAHREWLTPWTDLGRTPRLAFSDVEAKILVTHYLPGVLVLGTPNAEAPETYRQAGALLALLHGQAGVRDDGWEARENARSLGWLDGEHRIAANTVAQLRSEIARWPEPTAYLVPTHGDWQPRNWLIHEGVVSVIDFGRAALRPAATDFTRLAVQDFRDDPDLEAAFLEGYGADPRDPAAWHRMRIREAIGTTGWAYQVGDAAFEAQGHRMIADALAG